MSKTYSYYWEVVETSTISITITFSLDKSILLTSLELLTVLSVTAFIFFCQYSYLILVKDMKFPPLYTNRASSGLEW